MGIILMRPLSSGVFQRLMADVFPEIDTLKVGRLSLNYVLSGPYVDVALVGGHEVCLSEAHLGSAARSACALSKFAR